MMLVLKLIHLCELEQQQQHFCCPRQQMVIASPGRSSHHVQ
jgi:hypothetical protein